MKRNPQIINVIVAFFIFLNFCVSLFGDQGVMNKIENGIQIDQKNIQGDMLQAVLLKAADYCRRMKSIALHYICTEEVLERIYHPYRYVSVYRTVTPNVEENSYLYDYQLIKRANEDIEETRTLLRKNRKRCNEKNSELETKRFRYKTVVFGPVGLFSDRVQKDYSYTIKKETKLWQKKVVIVDAVPLNPASLDRLYGRAWIEKETGSILKIEWEDHSVTNYDKMKIV